MNSSLLSIVIPCKNEEKQLLQTLTALEGQSFDLSNVQSILPMQDLQTKHWI